MKKMLPDGNCPVASKPYECVSLFTDYLLKSGLNQNVVRDFCEKLKILSDG
jgi:hypothetical protein